MTVTSGQVYTISEKGAGTPTADLTTYTSSYVCTWTDSSTLGNGVLTYSAGTGVSSATLPAIPAGKVGQTLSCVISNTAKAPPQLALQKSIAGRFTSTDQFRMDVRQSGSSTDLATATTTGSTTGSQLPLAGPVTVTPGVAYTIAETGASGASLGNYTYSYACTWSGGGTLSGTALAYSAATGRAQATLDPISTGREGQTLNCVLTNQAKGWVTWEKVDDATGAALAGTEWRITGPSLPGSGVDVIDCVAANDAACPSGDHKDRDSRPGHFRIDGLVHGSHQLVETANPPGYVLDPTVRNFIVSMGAGVNAGTVRNVPLPGGIAWESVDAAASSVHLKGSTWKIVGPDPTTTERAVADCFGTNLPSAGVCAVDTDARPGRFAVENLAWGSYQLVATTAPPGYVLDPTPHPFVIAGTALEPSLGQIGSTVRVGPALPLTGGLGRDHIYLAGASLLLLSLAGFGSQRLRAGRITRRA
ncbi:MAG: hypothetical protein IPJ61_13125 [Tessaracoccus sp.]|nr:SpaA isopeptide-forming pilin-related protein [Tessaracoccus sp.]MBK7821976.1 hypothetical protein [Tessaracoccus sp.]